MATDFSIAKEVGRHGITVNAYAPGIIRTPMCEIRSNVMCLRVVTHSFYRGGGESADC